MAKHRYAQGSNMPGYMPDSEPYIVTSFKDAKECMLDDLERDIMGAMLEARFAEDTEDRSRYARILWDYRRAVRSLRKCKGYEWGWTVSGANRHYFISRV